MRGRTNAGGSGTLSINGELKNFKVAENQSVVAGDFIEYSSKFIDNLFTSFRFGAVKTDFIGENLGISLCNGVLYLVSSANDKLKIIDSYSSKVVVDYTILKNKDIVILTETAPYLTRIRVEYNMFQYIGDSGTEEKAMGDCLDFYEEKIYVARIEHIQEVNYDYLYIYTFSVEMENTILYSSAILEDVRITYSSYDGKGLGYLVCAKEKAFIFKSGKTYAFDFSLGQENLIEIGNSGSYRPELFYEKYILYKYTSGTSAYIGVINAETLAKNEKRIEDFSLSENMDAYVTKKFNEGKIFYFSSRKIANGTRFQATVLDFEKQSGSISSRCNKLNITYESGNTSIADFYLNGKIYAVYSDENNISRSISLEYDEESDYLSEELEDEEGYVKPYSGGKAIGVSKQSGNSGQKIEVYVPNPQ